MPRVAYTFKGKMEVQYDNPYEVGMTGLLGMPSGYYSMHEAEVLVMLGTDFPYSAFLPDDIKIAQIDIKAERLGRRTKVDIGLCGDVKSTLQALLPMLQQKKDNSFLLKQLKRYEGVKKDLIAYTEDRGKENLIHPEYVMSEIDKLASDDAIFTVDTGMTCVWGARYLQATERTPYARFFQSRLNGKSHCHKPSVQYWLAPTSKLLHSVVTEDCP